MCKTYAFWSRDDPGRSINHKKVNWCFMSASQIGQNGRGKLIAVDKATEENCRSCDPDRDRALHDGHCPCCEVSCTYSWCPIPTCFRLHSESRTSRKTPKIRIIKNLTWFIWSDAPDVSKRNMMIVATAYQVIPKPLDVPKPLKTSNLLYYPP